MAIAYHHVTGVCLQDLHAQLLRYGDRIVKIGSFSACSNVTGLLTDVDEVSILLHRHGALAIFDYATAAPYVKVIRYNNFLFYSYILSMLQPNCT